MIEMGENAPELRAHHGENNHVPDRLLLAHRTGRRSGQSRHRVGHMARTASYEYIMTTISALELTMRELGIEVEVGAAVAAAHEVFEKEGKTGSLEMKYG